MLKSQVIGNVGSAKFHKSGESKVLTVTVASNERRKEKVHTNWVILKIWGELAERLKGVVVKGRKVYAEGRPEAEAYAKKNGTPASSLVIHVDGHFELLDPPPKSVVDAKENKEEDSKKKKSDKKED